MVVWGGGGGGGGCIIVRKILSIQEPVFLWSAAIASYLKLTLVAFSLPPIAALCRAVSASLPLKSMCAPAERRGTTHCTRPVRPQANPRGVSIGNNKINSYAHSVMLIQ